MALLAGVEARTLDGKSWDDAGNTRRKAFLETQKAEVERRGGTVCRMEQPVLAATYDDMAYTTTRTVAALGIEVSPFGFTKPEVVAWAASTLVDGLVLNFFAKDQPRPRLARHGNCRCTYVPVARSWRDFAVAVSELAPVKRLVEL